MLIYLKVKKLCIMYLFLYYFIKQKIHPTFIDFFICLLIYLFIYIIYLSNYIYLQYNNKYVFI